MATLPAPFLSPGHSCPPGRGGSPISGRQAFLKAIAADPDDDGPRLAFADWLEEQGDPRGEFIRVQCALAKLPAKDPRRKDLVRKEKALLKAHGASWADALPAHGEYRIKPKPALWKRGFPSGASFNVQEFLEWMGEVLRQDVVQDVVLEFTLDYDRPDVDKDAWVKRLAASPWLRLVSTLDGADTSFGPRRFATLMRSLHLTHLEKIDLFEDVIGLKGVRALCAAPAPFTLRWLRLNGAINCDVREETPDAVKAVRLLANSPKVAHLEYLGLYYNGLGEGAVAALVASPYLPRPLKLEFFEPEGLTECMLDRLRQEFGSS